MKNILVDSIKLIPDNKKKIIMKIAKISIQIEIVLGTIGIFLNYNNIIYMNLYNFIQNYAGKSITDGASAISFVLTFFIFYFAFVLPIVVVEQLFKDEMKEK